MSTTRTTPAATPALRAAPAVERVPAHVSVLRLLRSASRLDRTQSDPVVSLRNAVGVALPLAAGALAGGAALGLASTVGGLQAALADRPGPYRLRIARILITSLAAALTSGVAVLASPSPAASVVLLLVLAFGAGLLLTAGPSASQVGTAGVAAALILGHTPRPASAAVEVALLVFAGGAVQAVLAVAGWPLGRHRPERTVLAELYRTLAASARVPEGDLAGPPAGDALAAARQALYGLGHDHGPSVEAYRVLLDEAERIRRETVVIVAAAQRLAAERNPILAGFVREGLTATAAVLDQIATSLATGKAVRKDVLDRARATLRFAVARLAAPAGSVAGTAGSSAGTAGSSAGARGGIGDAVPGELTRRAAAARLRALSGQLRAALESTRTGADEGRDGARDARERDRLRDPMAILRANLTPDSAVLRHSVRVALLVAGSDLVTRLAGVDRGYWVPLTVLVVLRPDFGTTLQRSVLRTAGTVVGLLVASELVHWVPGGQWWQIALVLVFAFGMRFAGPGNIAQSAASLSGLVVVLLALDGIAPHTALVDRSAATLVGGVLAVAGTLALPGWERSFLRDRMAGLLAAYRAYLDALAHPLHDADADRARLQQTRAAARLARSNAQASLDRAVAEPVPAQAEIELGRAVLAHTHRFVHAALALDAVRRPVREAGALSARPGAPAGELRGFLDAVRGELGAVQAALRDGEPPRSATGLRARYETLAAALQQRPEQVGGAEVMATVLDACDRMTDSLDTLAGELRRQHAAVAAPAPPRIDEA